jgi:hypothetical protein
LRTFYQPIYFTKRIEFIDFVLFWKTKADDNNDNVNEIDLEANKENIINSFFSFRNFVNVKN